MNTENTDNNDKNNKQIKCNACKGNCTCIRLGKLVEKDYDNIDFSYFDDLEIFKGTEDRQVNK